MVCEGLSWTPACAGVTTGGQDYALGHKAKSRGLAPAFCFVCFAIDYFFFTAFFAGLAVFFAAAFFTGLPLRFGTDPAAARAALLPAIRPNTAPDISPVPSA